jgi:catechol 2,3-dioxygenase-like lactoylglutathione lyase family enzyme
MAEFSFGSHEITHIGLIVTDIEKSAAEYAKRFGIKVPGIGETDAAEKTGALYRGKPTGARARLCHIPMGHIQTELIQPLGGPSVWKDFLDTHGDGIHHVAIVVKDSRAESAAMTALGFPVLQEGDFGTGRYVYLDTYKSLGLCVELIEVY